VAAAVHPNASDIEIALILIALLFVPMVALLVLALTWLWAKRKPPPPALSFFDVIDRREWPRRKRQAQTRRADRA
jgi:hypothetical protein